MKTFSEIIKSRGLTELPYQKDFLINPIYKNPSKPVVFAAGTSAGKTFTMAMWLEIFYSNVKNRNKISMLVPASKAVLRDNTENSFNEFSPSFTYRVCKDKNELKQAIKDKIQVIIALPQTLIASINILPKVDRFILDEAHQWYFKNTIQSIIKRIKPNYQLLLTGSPSPFVAQSDKFICKFIPVMELYELGQIHNAKIEVVSSSYNFRQSDYRSSYGNLKSNKTNSPIKAKQALEMVIDEMITKLKTTTGSKITQNWKGINKVNSFFTFLDKTIIYTHSLKQADAFYNILNKKMNKKVLLSHSISDSDSELFSQFQKDNNIKILIAVDRGRLGYNMPELFNVVDFTMTQSLDMLLQIYGRLLRKSFLQPDKQKIYFKVATKNTADYFVDLMTAMLCLTTNDKPTYYYSSYNGKNMTGIRIPKVLTKITNQNYQLKQNKNKSNKVKPYVSLTELGISPDLNLFKQSFLHSSDGVFNSIAWTTLEDVRKQFFKIKKRIVWNYDLCKEEAKKYNLRNKFKLQTPQAYLVALKNGWLDEICNHMKSKNKIWNEKSIILEAKKYSRISDFTIKAPGAHKAAKRLGILEIVTKKYKTYMKFSNEQIFEDAKKYKTISEWRKNNPSFYWAAKRRGIFNKCIKIIS